MSDTEFGKTLKNFSKSWASKLVSLAKSKAPSHIAPSIYAKSNITEGKSELTIGVRRIETTKNGAISNYGTTDAKAWEYGSGIHRRKSTVDADWRRIFKATGNADIASANAGKYAIKPRNKKILAFFWDINQENEDELLMGSSSQGHQDRMYAAEHGGESKIHLFPTLPDGRTIFGSVRHPGVEARPYIRPAVIEWRKDLDKTMPEFKKSIVVDLRKGFKLNTKGITIKQ